MRSTCEYECGVILHTKNHVTESYISSKRGIPRPGLERSEASAGIEHDSSPDLVIEARTALYFCYLRPKLTHHPIEHTQSNPRTASRGLAYYRQ
jgi:hypothetical protein